MSSREIQALHGAILAALYIFVHDWLAWTIFCLNQELAIHERTVFGW